MRVALSLIKKHPVAIIFLILYTLSCVHVVNLEFQLLERIKENPGISGIEAGGEGVGFTGFFLLIIGGIFFIICCGYAIAKPKETWFYLSLIVIIIVETIAVFNIRWGNLLVNHVHP